MAILATSGEYNKIAKLMVDGSWGEAEDFDHLLPGDVFLVQGENRGPWVCMTKPEPKEPPKGNTGVMAIPVVDGPPPWWYKETFGNRPWPGEAKAAQPKTAAPAPGKPSADPPAWFAQLYDKHLDKRKGPEELGDEINQLICANDLFGLIPPDCDLVDHVIGILARSEETGTCAEQFDCRIRACMERNGRAIRDGETPLQAAVRTMDSDAKDVRRFEDFVIQSEFPIAEGETSLDVAFRLLLGYRDIKKCCDAKEAEIRGLCDCIDSSGIKPLDDDETPVQTAIRTIKDRAGMDCEKPLAGEALTNAGQHIIMLHNFLLDILGDAYRWEKQAPVECAMEQIREYHKHLDSSGFDSALTLMQLGYRATRQEWEGNWFVVLMPRLDLPPFDSQGPGAKVNDRTAKFIGRSTPLHSQPYFAMFNVALQKWQPGWVPSIEDLVAEDWTVYKRGEDEE